MEISQDVVNVLNSLIEPRSEDHWAQVFGIVVKHNIDNVLRLLFKRNIKVHRIENCTTDLYVDGDWEIKVSDDSIDFPEIMKPIDGVCLFFTKDQLKHDVKVNQLNCDEKYALTLVNDHPLGELDLTLTGGYCIYPIYSIYPMYDIFVIRPLEDTVDKLQDLINLMNRLKDEGRLPKDAKIECVSRSF